MKFLNKKKLVSAVLAGAMMTIVALPAFVAGGSYNDTTSIDHEGDRGNSKVEVTSTVDGTLPDGPNGEHDPEGTTFSVTIPTYLPVAVSKTGEIVVSNTAKIINNSYGPVKVTNVDINNETWNLEAFTNKATFGDYKVDSNKIGFSLQLGNGVEHKTQKAGNQALVEADEAFMKGVNTTQDEGNANESKIIYNALVSPLSAGAQHANAATVVFTVNWDK